MATVPIAIKTHENADATVHTAFNDRREGLSVTHTYNVIPLKPTKHVLVDVENAKKIKAACQEASRSQTIIGDLLLSAASFFLSAVLSAVISGIPYAAAFRSIFFYTICPVLGIGALVGFLFCRAKDAYTLRYFAQKIEDCIPNIDENEIDEANVDGYAFIKAAPPTDAE